MKAIDFRIYSTATEMSQAAAEEIRAFVSSRSSALITLPTGNTPTETYALLSRMAEGHNTFSRLRLFKLDEWGGLPMDHPGSCESYLRKHVIQPWKLREDQVITYESNPEDPEKEVAKINTLLEQHGPLDLCVLGLGANGHLALNEPNRFLQPHAHIADLSEKSRSHSMLQQAEGRKIYGLTLGIAQLLQARKIFLLVSGKSKFDQMQRLKEKKVTTEFPASFLWLHPDVICFCDEAAHGGR